jgi:hypothetical protein
LLLDKLRERFPTFCRALSSDIPEAQHRKLFRNSFRFVVQAYRRDSVNPEVDGIWWINEAREFLRSVGGDNDVSWPAICAAVIGAGDILHTGAASFPYAYFGLARGSRSFAYRPIFREILAGERDFLPAVEKGSRATLEYSSPGYETDIPTNMRRAGLL